MKARIILAASVVILATGCSRGGSSEDGDRETAVEVASRPFTIGNEVADQMGSHVGDMGTDREGDPALNAMAEEADVPVGAVEARPGDPDTASSRFTTEGGPEF